MATGATEVSGAAAAAARREGRAGAAAVAPRPLRRRPEGSSWSRRAAEVPAPGSVTERRRRPAATPGRRATPAPRGAEPGAASEGWPTATAPPQAAAPAPEAA